MKNCLIQNWFYGFKAGKIWCINFLCFEISEVIFISFSRTITNPKNIKFRVKKYGATLVLNLTVKEIFHDNLSRYMNHPVHIELKISRIWYGEYFENFSPSLQKRQTHKNSKIAESIKKDKEEKMPKFDRT